MKAILLSAIFLIFTSSSAFAHRPYIVKQGGIKDPNGNILIKEKLYGDGIFTSDPQSFQIRNLKGSVLAATSVATHVAVFCPNVDFCWVFPYGQFSLFSYGFKLDAASINWDSTNALPNFQKENDEDEEKAFSHYLNNADQKHFHSYNLGYPELRDEAMSGFLPVTWSIIVSPCMIFVDQIQFMMAAMMVAAIFVWIFIGVQRLIKNKPMGFKIFVGALGSLLVLGSGAVLLAVSFFMSFTLSANIIWLLAGLVIGISSPIWAKHIKERRRLKSASFKAH